MLVRFDHEWHVEMHGRSSFVVADVGKEWKTDGAAFRRRLACVACYPVCSGNVCNGDVQVSLFCEY